VPARTAFSPGDGRHEGAGHQELYFLELGLGMVLAAGKANQPGLATVTGSGTWG
jgi:hypothetical protein